MIYVVHGAATLGAVAELWLASSSGDRTLITRAVRLSMRGLARSKNAKASLATQMSEFGLCRR